MKYNTQYQKGFTLLEIVVVLAIFSVIMLVVISIFLSVIQQQNRILIGQELFNQLNYATEYMARPMRLAQMDKTGSCTGLNNQYALTHPNNGFFEGIKFLTNDGVCEEFYLDRSSGLPYIFKEVKGGVTQNVLSSKFNIQYVRFVINGNSVTSSATINDLVQPRVTILVDIKTAGTDTQEKIIQTTVSQRNLNIKTQ